MHGIQQELLYALVACDEVDSSLVELLQRHLHPLMIQAVCLYGFLTSKLPVSIKFQIGLGFNIILGLVLHLAALPALKAIDLLAEFMRNRFDSSSSTCLLLCTTILACNGYVAAYMRTSESFAQVRTASLHTAMQGKAGLLLGLTHRLSDRCTIPVIMPKSLLRHEARAQHAIAARKIRLAQARVLLDRSHNVVP